jgi:hypothetical protein
MKTKSSQILLALYLRSTKGFALPLAIGFGAMMLLVGTTMIVRSNDDRLISVRQKQTSESFSVAEGGISRSLALMNGNYEVLLRRSRDPLNSRTGKTYLGANHISDDGDGETTGIDEWGGITNVPCFDAAGISGALLSGIIGTGTTTNYNLLAYRYNAATRTGTMLVRGVGADGQSNAVLQQSVRIDDINSSDPMNFPGLLATDINLGNNDVLGSVAGNVICTSTVECPVPSNQCVAGQPTQDGLRQSIGAQNNGVVQGKIYVKDMTWPPLPQLSPSAPRTANLSNINDSLTLPRPGDTAVTAPDGTEAYVYNVGSVSLSGNKTLTINSSDKPVYFFLTGNMSMSGNASLNHIPPTDRLQANGGDGAPERFRIYGNPSDNNSANDQQLTLSGGANTANLFIYAPDATTGINGGSSNPDIRGAVWTKKWNGSSSNVAEIQVPDNMPQLLGGVFANFDVGDQTTAATNWTQRPDPNAL